MKGMDADTGRAIDGIEHLKQSIKDILNTPLGSRVMRRTYGSRLFELLDNPCNSEGIADIVAATAEALKKWEHRMDVTKVIVVSARPGNIEVDIVGKYKPSGEPIRLEGIEVK